MTDEGDRILNHEECVELLPWYAAGSLPAGEAAAVTGHLRDCVPCRSELARTREAARLFAAEHPAPETLIALAWDALSAPEARAVEEHVDGCPDCREEAALARASRALELAAGDRVLSPMRARGARRPGARAAVAAASAAAVLALAVGGAGVWRASRASERLRAADVELATARAVAADGGEARRALAAASERVAELEARVGELLRPRAGLAIVELLPDLALRGDAPSTPEAVVAPATGFLALQLALERPQASRGWSVRLRGPDGEVLWSAAGVEADARGALGLLVPSTLLPAGDLRIEVAGEGAGAAVPPAVYRFVVRPAGSSR